MQRLSSRIVKKMPIYKRIEALDLFERNKQYVESLQHLSADEFFDYDHSLMEFPRRQDELYRIFSAKVNWFEASQFNFIHVMHRIEYFLMWFFRFKFLD